MDAAEVPWGIARVDAPAAWAVMCVNGDVQATTYAVLAARVPECDGVSERVGQSCTTAIHRFCAARGAVSGFGPVQSAADIVTVTCLTRATVVRTPLATLRSHASRCDPHPVTCSTASWNLCVSLGHAAGFGPVEAAGDDVDVVCVDP